MLGFLLNRLPKLEQMLDVSVEIRFGSVLPGCSDNHANVFWSFQYAHEVAHFLPLFLIINAVRYPVGWAVRHDD